MRLRGLCLRSEFLTLALMQPVQVKFAPTLNRVTFFPEPLNGLILADFR